jgi:hypothetical protein
MMALFMRVSNVVTIAPGETAYVTWAYNDNQDHGPNYISAAFEIIYTNMVVTTTQTSVNCSYDRIGLPHDRISYSGQLRNDGQLPAGIAVNIGNFE